VQKKLKELNDTLEGFVDQADYLTLVVGADDGTAVMVLSALQGLDQKNGADVFVVIPDETGPAPAYLTAMATRIESERMVVNDVLEAEGKPPWPEIPVLCFDARQPDGERLHALVEYVRARMPEGDHRLVWALMPTAIKDQAGYAQIVGLLVPRGEIQPWMRGARFLVRDDRAQPFITPALKKMQAPGVLTYAPDFSSAGVEAALNDEAADESASVGQRMTSLLQLAALDYSFGRLEPAIEKYRVLMAWFQQTGAKEMQGLCLQGVGDILRRIGNKAAAKEKYEQGMLLVADSQAFVVTLNLAVSLGDTCLDLGQLEQAHGYFQLGDQIATKIINPFVKADCLEKLGVVHERRGELGPAAKIWTDATKLCRQMEYDHRLASILERLAAMFRKARMGAELRAAEAELAVLKKKGRA
jgi:tetratricopeptide (TPR) repeat protein